MSSDASDSITHYESAITDAKIGNETIIIACNCEVYYDGRARSDLHGGDRLVILKPDGTVLVHGPEKQKPRNWMTPGTNTEVVVEDNTLVIRATQSSKEGVEELEIRIEDVYELSSHRLLDGREKDLTGTEEDLKERLVDNPSLIEDGFRVEETEWETDAGPVDIFGYDRDGNAALVELKRRQIDPEAVHQLRRYLEVGFDTDFEENDVRGVLVAPEISEQASNLAEDYGFMFVEEDPRRKVSSETTNLTDF